MRATWLGSLTIGIQVHKTRGNLFPSMSTRQCTFVILAWLGRSDRFETQASIVFDHDACRERTLARLAVY